MRTMLRFWVRISFDFPIFPIFLSFYVIACQLSKHKNICTSIYAKTIDPPPAKLGYKQELRRNFGILEVFGIAFSIMGLLPSIASTLAYSLPGGMVGLVWVCMFVFLKGGLEVCMVRRGGLVIVGI